MILVAIELAVSRVCHPWDRTSSQTEVDQKYIIISNSTKLFSKMLIFSDNIILCLDLMKISNR